MRSCIPMQSSPAHSFMSLAAATPSHLIMVGMAWAPQGLTDLLCSNQHGLGADEPMAVLPTGVMQVLAQVQHLLICAYKRPAGDSRAQNC